MYNDYLVKISLASDKGSIQNILFLNVTELSLNNQMITELQARFLEIIKSATEKCSGK